MSALVVALVVATLSVAGCGPGGDVDGDGGADAAGEADVGGRGDGDEGELDGGEPQPGPLTLIATEIVVLEERICDLDGDGQLDNAIADLGPAPAALFAAALNQAFASTIDLREERLLFHAPRIDDLSVPETDGPTLIAIDARDTDFPGDSSDDFSGDEPFYARAEWLDACGEPPSSFESLTIRDGELEAGPGTIHLPSFAPARQVMLSGAVAPGGSSAELRGCAVQLIRDLGGTVVDMQTEEVDLLSMYLAGGALFGMPSVSGVEPDLDLDGDGLERIELDADHQVESCVDGDLTVIPGRDCWQDPRMADGFSLNLGMSGVSARFLGPVPSWEWETEGDCPELPVEPSVWGECAVEECPRWSTRGCAPPCGASGVERCRWDCGGYGACRPETAESYRPASCEELVLEGDASCAGDPPVVRLADGAEQASGVRVAREIAVGYGPVTIEAAMEATRGASAYPGVGWVLAAYLASDEPFLGQDSPSVGQRWSRTGYAMLWRFHAFADAEDEDDMAELVVADGIGEGRPENWIHAMGGPFVGPDLDASTEGTVEQRVRLVIEPDLPDTEENEQIVVAQLFREEGFYSPRLACYAERCPTPIVPGDRLHVGVAATTGWAHSVLEVGLESGLSIEVQGGCPE